ncbi:helix-hairpin-helix domain-containing protein [Staphylococcus sp. GDY8P94P]|uniref:helix-hairpin-helix domain-containing protein n=1 Tax=Staphylococcus sp. GDY8P94P TaxID=2804144 RepID=UPI001AEC4D04|nr:helix-hairpin-helix domain-containing protein [Staphylococcus sp. GDY8P94P]
MLPLWELFKERFSQFNSTIKVCVMLFIIVTVAFTLSFLINRDNEQMKKSNDMTPIELPEHNQSIPNEKSEHSSNKNETLSNDHTKDSFVYVDIKGAVKYPNVYKMRNNDRVKQLLDKAIVSEHADLTNINLSERLIDQKMIYIPKKGEHAHLQAQNQLNKSETATNFSEKKDADGATVNLNTAKESELTSIPGIGKVKAKAIIEYREQNGNFKSIDQLKEINGFGTKTIEKLSSYLTI